MDQDFISPEGQGNGSVAALMLRNNFDPACMKPYVGDDGRSYISRNTGKFDKDGKPIYNAVVTNADALLRIREWIELDTVVQKIAKNRLRAFADLRAAGLSYNMSSGMGKTVLESQRQSDVTGASISMDGLRKTENDRPVFDTIGLPLPIISKDFQISARQLATSRQNGGGVDTTMAEAAARKVAEGVEDLTLGTAASFQYGGYSLYGYTNYTSRITATMTLPTAVGWTPADTLDEVLAMKAQSIAAFHYGPWFLYTSPNWEKYLDGDYSAAKGTITLRDRLSQIEGVDRARTLDRLTGYQMILVQKSSDVARAVVAMDITTLQWPTEGGLMLNFKVMCIMVPQLRADYNSNTGIVHGTAT